MKALRPLYYLLVAPLLVPLQLMTALLHVHVGRFRVARAKGDRGALSIEFALIVFVVVVLAGLVLAAVTTLGEKAKAKIPQDDGVVAPK